MVPSGALVVIFCDKGGVWEASQGLLGFVFFVLFLFFVSFVYLMFFLLVFCC